MIGGIITGVIVVGLLIFVLLRKRVYEVGIPMKIRIGLVVVSIFLVHCAGTWAYTFFIIIRQGEISFYEPNRLWLMAEFGFAIALTLLGLFFLGVVIRETRRKTVKK